MFVDRSAEKPVLRCDLNVLNASHSVQWSLSSLRGHIREHSENREASSQPVPHRKGRGAGRDGADIVVGSLARAFPVLVPTVVRIHDPTSKHAAGKQHRIVDGLRPQSGWYRQSDDEHRTTNASKRKYARHGIRGA